MRTRRKKTNIVIIYYSLLIKFCFGSFCLLWSPLRMDYCPFSEAAEEFLGAVRTTPLSAYEFLSSPHSRGSVVGRGRVVLRSTKRTGVYWGVAATGGGENAERRAEREDRALAFDHSAEKLTPGLFNLLMRRFPSVFPPTSGGDDK